MKPTIVSIARWTACVALAVVVRAVRCPPSCQDLFTRLEDGVQEVQVQLRGGATGHNVEFFAKKPSRVVV